MRKKRLCKICNKPLSIYNGDIVCFCHKEHPLYNESLIVDHYVSDVKSSGAYDGYCLQEYNWIPINANGEPRKLNFDYIWPE